LEFIYFAQLINSFTIADWERKLLDSGNLNFLRRPTDYVLGRIGVGNQIHLVHRGIITSPRVVGILYETFGEMSSERIDESSEQEGWLDLPPSYIQIWNQSFSENYPYSEDLNTAQLELTWMF
jgi:hypothetical protein